MRRLIELHHSKTFPLASLNAGIRTRATNTRSLKAVPFNALPNQPRISLRKSAKAVKV